MRCQRHDFKRAATAGRESHLTEAAYYENLRGGLFSLLILLENHLGGQAAQQVHEFIGADEYGLTLPQQHRDAVRAALEWVRGQV